MLIEKNADNLRYTEYKVMVLSLISQRSSLLVTYLYPFRICESYLFKNGGVLIWKRFKNFKTMFIFTIIITKIY